MPDLPEDRQIIKSDCALCVNCCGIDAYVSRGRFLMVKGMKEHPVNRGGLCPKGANLVAYAYSPDRLQHPLKKTKAGWKKISWDDALDYIAAKLQDLKDRYGARSLAVYCGSVGVEHVEALLFAQRFRGAYGTPNMLSVESGCFRQRIISRQMTFGRYITEDVENSNCIVLWGHNPHDSRWTVADRIRERLQKGASLIVVDPRRIPLASEALHLQLRPGTDCALALGLMHVIIAESLYDGAFIDKWATGFDRLREHAKAFTPEKTEEITWVPAADIVRAARLFAARKGTSIVQGTCTLDRQINDVQNSRALALLQTITGNIENPGGWASSRVVPLADLSVPVAEPPLGEEEYPLHNVLWGRRLPYGHALLFPRAVLEGKPYPVKALIVTAGNPALTMPDSKTYLKALGRLDLLVTIDIFMNETAELSHLVLPASSFLEQSGIGCYPTGLMAGVSYIMKRKKIIDPIGESKPDWLIWSELGRKMGFGSYFPWQTDEEMTDYLLAPAKITTKQLDEHPEGMLYAPRSYELYRKIGFKTPSGKIEIYSETLAQAGFDPLPTHREPTRSPLSTPALAEEYPLILITGARQRECIHTQMKNIPEFRRLAAEPAAEIHPAAAALYGIADGQKMFVETMEGRIIIRARVTERIAERVISVPHGWAVANVNELVSGHGLDPILGCPEDKGLLCRVGPVGNI